MQHIVKAVITQYKHVYPELQQNQQRIIQELNLEEERFQRTLKQGLREFDKLKIRLETNIIDGQNAFHLYDTFGFPIEFTLELARENNLEVDTAGFEAAFKRHQEVSSAGAEQRFKGGLADTSEQTARLHTATHLLLASLKKVLKTEVEQRGSNITAERLRFDFSFPRKMEKEEIEEVEKLVNEAIAANVHISCEELPLEDARNAGATGIFESRYGNIVKVFTMGDFSRKYAAARTRPARANSGILKYKRKKARLPV